MPRRVRAVLLVLIPCLALSAAPADGKSFDEDLDRRDQKELIELTQAYLDPTLEFTWRARKDLLARLAELEEEEGIRPMQDLEFLRELVYSGRHFMPEYDHKDFETAYNAVTRKSSIYRNVTSERLRLTYALPREYPSSRSRDRKIPRDKPFPLLLTLHDEEDYFTNREAPGEAVLERRWEKGEVGEFYDRWIALAPVAPRGAFTEEDKAIKHRLATAVLTETWTRYHVDFDRIVLEGKSDAAIIASAYPYIYAGLVLRGGEIEPDLVSNYASVPVYVVGDEALAAALEEAGHPDVTLGEAGEPLVAWLDARRRTVPTTFTWHVKRPDHQMANWINIQSLDWSAPDRVMHVEVIDTEDQPNTVKIDTEAIFEVSVFLNDQIVDLDRPVGFLLNGEAREPQPFERSFGQLFEQDPNVRKAMYFGWLYPTFLQGLRLPIPEPEAPAEDTEEAGGEDADEEAPAEEGPRGSPIEEARARSLFEAAEQAAERGDVAQARSLYEDVIAVGTTSYRPQAEERLAELDEGSE